jgi:hypothetical protein
MLAEEARDMADAVCQRHGRFRVKLGECERPRLEAERQARFVKPIGQVLVLKLPTNLISALVKATNPDETLSRNRGVSGVEQYPRKRILCTEPSEVAEQWPIVTAALARKQSNSL